MRCQRCGHKETRVLQTRELDGAIRRRRQCANCNARFNTFERYEVPEYYVVKSDERRETFQREKVLAGLKKACEKRPVSISTLEQTADALVDRLQERGETEIPSKLLGEWVMEALREIDQVAYVRFASVYRQFKDVGEFHDILQQLQKQPS